MSTGSDLVALTRRLCQVKTAVVADGNQELFSLIEKELPLERFFFRSGDSFNGWMVPDNWKVIRARIFCEGEEVFDCTQNALGVAYYSKSFTGDLTLEQLKQFVVTNPDLPDAFMFHCMWQYRPWDAQWALSIPYEVFKNWPEGRYRVDLSTEYSASAMIVAHSEVKGESDKTIIFNSHTCHPHMANDGLAGAAIFIRLLQQLSEQKNYYTYRLVLAPEHIGTVFYLRDQPEQEISNMVCGVFQEMPGTSGNVKATSTFNGSQKIDLAFSNVLKHSTCGYEIVPWRKGAGNDETVWEAPGYEVPFVELTRCEDQFAPFPEYHSNLDTADILDEKQMAEMYRVLEELVFILEHDATLHRKFNGLICLSNPEYDLYMERPDPTVVKDLEEDAEKWGHLLDCVFRYMDGSKTILEIAELHDLPFQRLYNYFQRFEEKGLVDLNFSEITRQDPSRC
ncbi:MAG: DUF4910 domain-containing protein [Thalassospira sp.]|uniref:DUF4910 domain-containing protein n=1 Tax=Thalassospira sp. TaxID=1912094 RepID=UPI003A8C1A74